jgi:TRAP-type mannitol/chloroaromatic compound transport system substrate-binding protein
MDAAWTAASEIYAEISAQNPGFKATFDSMAAFRAEQYLWWQLAEFSFDGYMIRKLRG